MPYPCRSSGVVLWRASLARSVSGEPRVVVFQGRQRHPRMRGGAFAGRPDQTRVLLEHATELLRVARAPGLPAALELRLVDQELDAGALGVDQDRVAVAHERERTAG